MARTATFAYDPQIDAIVDAALGAAGIIDQLTSVEGMEWAVESDCLPGDRVRPAFRPALLRRRGAPPV
jgi:hypothetical protein